MTEWLIRVWCFLLGLCIASGAAWYDARVFAKRIRAELDRL